MAVPDHAVALPGHAISFGPFRLVPSQRLLLEDGKPVRLGSHALNILIALTERPNEIVSKEVLIARVWPDTFVEEGNLRVHVASLRRALVGASYAFPQNSENFFCLVQSRPAVASRRVSGLLALEISRSAGKAQS
jgi:hypothetical protein